MRWSEIGREPCSVARTLSVIGDRWTLLVLRECFLRVRRFDAFEQGLGIARHVLADRLKKLTEAGILARVPYQQRPARYEYRLTGKGLDLYPVVMAIVHWGDTHMAGDEGPPLLHEHKTCGHVMHAKMVCSECGEPLRARDVRVHAGPGFNTAGPAYNPSNSAVDK